MDRLDSIRRNDRPIPQRPRVLAVLPAFIPSTVLAVVKPLTNLHRAGAISADIALESWLSDAQIGRADVVVFCRNTNTAVLDRALRHGKPCIYNIDDDLTSTPAANETHLAAEEIDGVKRYLSAAALVRAYSEPLRNHLRQFSQNVEAVDCAVDWNLVPKSPPPRSSRISILYATSRWNRDQMAGIFLGDLSRVLDFYKDRVRAYFWGYHPRELRGHPSARFISFTTNYDRYFRRFTHAGFDIGLAPLNDDRFCQMKCGNKFREYAAARIAGIYSNVSVYSSLVEDGHSGLLVSNKPGEWFEAMRRLIEDAELRHAVQTAAFGVARHRYRQENSNRVWLAHIVRVMRETRPLTVAASGAVSDIDPNKTSWAVNFKRVRNAFARSAHIVNFSSSQRRKEAGQWIRFYGSSIVQLVRIRMNLAGLSARKASKLKT